MNTYLAALGISSDMIVARGLRAYLEATMLEVAEVGRNGREHLLTPSAAHAWRQLKAAAIEDGVDIFIVSAFRSIERQADIIRQKLASGSTMTQILAVSAPPGFSEHHTGRAIDVSTPGSPSLDSAFERTAAFAWLNTHAAAFGYSLSYPRGNAYGYDYEPWHWCFADKPATALG